MNELSNTEIQHDIAWKSRMEELTQEARMYSEAYAMNAFQLGRVFTEARKMLKHGEWLSWVRDNTGMSETYVRDTMRVYQKFGNNQSLLSIDKSKLFKLLALPEGKEDEFLEENDVANMTVREIGEAVKQARAEEQAKTAAAVEKAKQEAMEQASADAEDRIRQAEQRAAEAEQRATEAEEQAGSVQHFIELTQKANNDRAAAERERKSVEADMQEQQKQHEADMQEQQEAYDKLNQEYLNLKSQLQRGDADRTPTDDLTIGVFTSAVREFIGLCARMPYMGKTFHAMTEEERDRFNEQLSAIEGWALGARRAMNTYLVEGGAIDE